VRTGVADAEAVRCDAAFSGPCAGCRQPRPAGAADSSTPKRDIMSEKAEFMSGNQED
jgi:hypothetical protein